MNTTTSQASQAENSHSLAGFPQTPPSALLMKPHGDAVSAILELFDAGQIDGRIAEDWLLFVENLQNQL